MRYITIFSLSLFILGCGGSDHDEVQPSAQPTQPTQPTQSEKVDSVHSEAVLNAFGVDLYLADTDGDGLSDDYEISNDARYLDPLKKDTNGDGKNDGDEDFDKDGLTTKEESEQNTSPYFFDSDGDGLSDKQEVDLQFNPLLVDTDDDGLSDFEEFTNGLNPLKKDSDGDGVQDFDEKVDFVVNSDGLVLKISTQVQASHDISLDVIERTNEKLIDFEIPSSLTNEEFELQLSTESTPVVLIQDQSGNWSIAPESLIDRSNGVSLKTTYQKIDEEFSVQSVSTYVKGRSNSISTINSNGFAKLRLLILDFQKLIELLKDSFSNDIVDLSLNYSTKDGVIPDIDGLLLPPSPAFNVSKLNSHFKTLKLNESPIYLSGELLSSESDFTLIAYFESIRNPGLIFHGVTQTSPSKYLYGALESIIEGQPAAVAIVKQESTLKVFLNGSLVSEKPVPPDLIESNLTQIQLGGLLTGCDAELDEYACDLGAVDGDLFHLQYANKALSLGEIRNHNQGVYKFLLGDHDSDNDGLIDVEELLGFITFDGTIIKTDWLSTDTDGDGATDFEELADFWSLANEYIDSESTRLKSHKFASTLTSVSGFNLLPKMNQCYQKESYYYPNIEVCTFKAYKTSSDPLLTDSDGDGLSDSHEFSAYTDPYLKDTDKDGLSDYQEMMISTDPLDKDSDGDGYFDGIEFYLSGLDLKEEQIGNREILTKMSEASQKYKDDNRFIFLKRFFDDKDYGPKIQRLKESANKYFENAFFNLGFDPLEANTFIDLDEEGTLLTVEHVSNLLEGESSLLKKLELKVVLEVYEALWEAKRDALKIYRPNHVNNKFSFFTAIYAEKDSYKDEILSKETLESIEHFISTHKDTYSTQFLQGVIKPVADNVEYENDIEAIGGLMRMLVSLFPGIDIVDGFTNSTANFMGGNNMDAATDILFALPAPTKLGKVSKLQKFLKSNRHLLKSKVAAKFISSLIVKHADKIGLTEAQTLGLISLFIYETVEGLEISLCDIIEAGGCESLLEDEASINGQIKKGNNPYYSSSKVSQSFKLTKEEVLDLVKAGNTESIKALLVASKSENVTFKNIDPSISSVEIKDLFKTLKEGYKNKHWYQGELFINDLCKKGKGKNANCLTQISLTPDQKPKHIDEEETSKITKKRRPDTAESSIKDKVMYLNLHESKVGYVSNSAAIRSEVAHDCALLKKDSNQKYSTKHPKGSKGKKYDVKVNSITWHFLPSGEVGDKNPSLGVTKSVLELLKCGAKAKEEEQIKGVIHFPPDVEIQYGSSHIRELANIPLKAYSSPNSEEQVWSFIISFGDYVQPEGNWVLGVEFKDEKFAECVQEHVDTHEVYRLADLTTLDCRLKGIASADELSNMTGLINLNLAGNDLTTINLDSNLVLDNVDIRGNQFDESTLSYLETINWISDLKYKDDQALSLQLNNEFEVTSQGATDIAENVLSERIYNNYLYQGTNNGKLIVSNYETQKTERYLLENIGLDRFNTQVDNLYNDKDHLYVGVLEKTTTDGSDLFKRYVVIIDIDESGKPLKISNKALIQESLYSVDIQKGHGVIFKNDILVAVSSSDIVVLDFKNNLFTERLRKFFYGGTKSVCAIGDRIFAHIHGKLSEIEIKESSIEVINTSSMIQNLECINNFIFTDIGAYSPDFELEYQYKLTNTNELFDISDTVQLISLVYQDGRCYLQEEMINSITLESSVNLIPREEANSQYKCMRNNGTFYKFEEYYTSHMNRNVVLDSQLENIAVMGARDWIIKAGKLDENSIYLQFETMILKLETTNNEISQLFDLSMSENKIARTIGSVDSNGKKLMVLHYNHDHHSSREINEYDYDAQTTSLSFSNIVPRNLSGADISYCGKNKLFDRKYSSGYANHPYIIVLNEDNVVTYSNYRKVLICVDDNIFGFDSRGTRFDMYRFLTAENGMLELELINEDTELNNYTPMLYENKILLNHTAGRVDYLLGLDGSLKEVTMGVDFPLEIKSDFIRLYNQDGEEVVEYPNPIRYGNNPGPYPVKPLVSNGKLWLNGYNEGIHMLELR
ncbi:hypothetical protein AAEU28_15520 [Pseudoalteromonas sp. SS15]|uniref:hypothetical protein n=1 Tax=Pseudoalteromonas sp. SS15 TaxID=3139393 RepID=UPI003BAB4BFC